MYFGTTIKRVSAVFLAVSFVIQASGCHSVLGNPIYVQTQQTTTIETTYNLEDEMQAEVNLFEKSLPETAKLSGEKAFFFDETKCNQNDIWDFQLIRYSYQSKSFLYYYAAGANAAASSGCDGYCSLVSYNYADKKATTLYSEFFDSNDGKDLQTCIYDVDVHGNAVLNIGDTYWFVDSVSFGGYKVNNTSSSSSVQNNGSSQQGSGSDTEAEQTGSSTGTGQVMFSPNSPSSSDENESYISAAQSVVTQPSAADTIDVENTDTKPAEGNANGQKTQAERELTQFKNRMILSKLSEESIDMLLSWQKKLGLPYSIIEELCEDIFDKYSTEEGRNNSINDYNNAIKAYNDADAAAIGQYILSCDKMDMDISISMLVVDTNKSDNTKPSQLDTLISATKDHNDKYVLIEKWAKKMGIPTSRLIAALGSVSYDDMKKYDEVVEKWSADHATKVGKYIRCVVELELAATGINDENWKADDTKLDSLITEMSSKLEMVKAWANKLGIKYSYLLPLGDDKSEIIQAIDTMIRGWPDDKAKLIGEFFIAKNTQNGVLDEAMTISFDELNEMNAFDNNSIKEKTQNVQLSEFKLNNQITLGDDELFKIKKAVFGEVVLDGKKLTDAQIRDKKVQCYDLALLCFENGQKSILAAFIDGEAQKNTEVISDSVVISEADANSTTTTTAATSGTAASGSTSLGAAAEPEDTRVTVPVPPKGTMVIISFVGDHKTGITQSVTIVDHKPTEDASSARYPDKSGNALDVIGTSNIASFLREDRVYYDAMYVLPRGYDSKGVKESFYRFNIITPYLRFSDGDGEQETMEYKSCQIRISIEGVEHDELVAETEADKKAEAEMKESISEIKVDNAFATESPESSSSVGSGGSTTSAPEIAVEEPDEEDGGFKQNRSDMLSYTVLTCNELKNISYYVAILYCDRIELTKIIPDTDNSASQKYTRDSTVIIPLTSDEALSALDDIPSVVVDAADGNKMTIASASITNGFRIVDADSKMCKSVSGAYFAAFPNGGYFNFRNNYVLVGFNSAQSGSDIPASYIPVLITQYTDEAKTKPVEGKLPKEGIREVNFSDLPYARVYNFSLSA